jgi:fumarate hydratase, class I
MSDMVTIREEDLIESVADALQFISYYHPMDYIRALGAAYEAEQGPAAKDAIAQILTNSRMCAEGHRPICQDTGIVNVFVKWGQECRLEASRSLQDVVDEGVRRAYNHASNTLRASILADPAFTRRNTRDNTPCVLSVEMVPGDKVSIDVAAKGGGSENKSKFRMMNPSDNIVDWVLEMIPQMGAGWCPPGMLGIGIGGTAEHCMKLAKLSLMQPIDMAQLKQRGPENDIERLRIEIFDKVNALGIGAQGLGGLATVLDVKILDWPCHAAGKPVAMIPNCAATRHAHFTLDGSGPSYLEAPKLSEWPDVHWQPDAAAKRVDLDRLTPGEVRGWKAGDRLLLNGAMLTGRDAAHKRIKDMLSKGEQLPVSFKGRAIYYVGPVDPVMGEVVGCVFPPPPPPPRHPDGQVHRHDARTRAAGDDRQGRTRPGSGCRDRKAQGGIPDGGGRRGLSGGAGDQAGESGCVRGTRDGGDLRVHRRGHAGDRGRGQRRQQRPHAGSAALAREDRSRAAARSLSGWLRYSSRRGRAMVGKPVSTKA